MRLGTSILLFIAMSMCVQHENERMAKKVERQRRCDR